MAKEKEFQVTKRVRKPVKRPSTKSPIKIDTALVRPVGAPAFPWTDELEIEIADYIATHPMSLKKCYENNPHWPQINCIFERIHKSPKFGDMYLVAKQQQVFAFNEESINVLDEVKQDPDLVPWGREAIKQYNWQAARLKPRTFGDKSAIEVTQISHEASLDVLK
jgi:hypothetical protein